MTYKIALVSTHGTGKTALAILVAGELKRRGIRVKVVGEVATKAKEIGLLINEGTTKEAQLWILHTQFADELRYSNNNPLRPSYDVLICDRGPDNYCYLEQSVGRNDHALQMTLAHLREFSYSAIYLLPIVDSKVAFDGIRSVNTDFQKKMDKNVRNFLKEHKIGFIELPKPNIIDNYRNEWVKIIVNNTLIEMGNPRELLI